MPNNRAGRGIHKSNAQTWVAIAHYRHDSYNSSYCKKASLKGLATTGSSEISSIHKQQGTLSLRQFCGIYASSVITIFSLYDRFTRLWALIAIHLQNQIAIDLS